MLDLSKVKVSSSPHIRSDETTRQIMLDVVIALMPALAVSVFVFGWRSPGPDSFFGLRLHIFLNGCTVF